MIKTLFSRNRRRTFKRRPKGKINKAIRTVNRVQRLIGKPEVKWISSGLNTYAAIAGAAGSGTLQEYGQSFPVQGTGSSQRLGDRIRLVGMEVFWQVYNSNVNNTHWGARFMIIGDNTVDGLAVVSNDILAFNATAIQKCNSPFEVRTVGGRAHPAIKNREQRQFPYTLYKDKRISIGPEFCDVTNHATVNYTAGVGNPYRQFKWTLPLNINVTFEGNTGTVADVKDKYVYFLATCEQANATDVQMNYVVSYFYTDL